MLTSEYSSRWARTAPFSNVANMRRNEAISSSLGFFGDQPRRHAFERGPGRDQFNHLAPALAHHIHAAARLRPHEPFAFELRHGLAHRRAAYAELLRQAPFVEPDLCAAAIDVHAAMAFLSAV